jgi:hypothetical protein
MIAAEDVRTLLDDTFEEIGLALGGLVSVHPVPDEVIWRLCSSLKVIRGKALRRLNGETAQLLGGLARCRAADPHPAIELFLESLDRPGQ